MSETTILEARGLDKHFGHLHVTRSLDLTVQTGRIHALIGPNGAGKTTALSLLSGNLAPDAGRVVLNGRDITLVDLPRRVDMGICRSWQTSSPFAGFNVGENVVLSALAATEKRVRFFPRASADVDRNSFARSLLGDVGLTVDPSLPVIELDHGARRLLEIAMVLATRPSILLLDEPMAGLAPSDVRVVSDLLLGLKDDHGLLLVEHDMDVVFTLADEITVLADGAIVASDAPDAIRANPVVRALYLQEER
ncbi:MAG: ABC transporter ATP-binding protein [Acidimicrobiia bacterium]